MLVIGFILHATFNECKPTLRFVDNLAPRLGLNSDFWLIKFKHQSSGKPGAVQTIGIASVAAATIAFIAMDRKIERIREFINERNEADLSAEEQLDEISNANILDLLRESLMNNRDKNVLKYYRTTDTLLVVILVPLAYFTGAFQADEASIARLLALSIGGYVSCMLVAFAFVKIFGGWLPEDG